MRIETKRLIIDEIKEEDKLAYFNNISHDKRVLETFICKYADSIEEFDFSFYLNRKDLFAIRLKESEQLIGIILYFDATSESCEVGYGIGYNYWNQGYSTEALNAFLNYLFETYKFKKIYASHFVGNDASKRVMEKCNMHYDHTNLAELEYLGIKRDLIYYVIEQDYKYHYHPKKNWINDPNGLICFNDYYHVYYQYNPFGNMWGHISWGHAITKDFLNYEEKEVVLTPDKPYDKDGVFSGCSIVIDNKLYVYYTSVSNNKQTQSVAYSEDGYSFIKYEKNPIIDTNSEARDPYVFKYNDELYMIIGTKNKILLFKARSPFEFAYVSDLITCNTFAECPNIMALGDKYLLKYSNVDDRKDHFYLGSFDGYHFQIEKEISIDLPKNYYASQMFKHEDKIILIGWIANDNFETIKQYNGLLSIPRIIEYKDGKVTTKPYFSDEKEIIDNDIVELFN